MIAHFAQIIVAFLSSLPLTCEISPLYKSSASVSPRSIFNNVLMADIYRKKCLFLTQCRIYVMFLFLCHGKCACALCAVAELRIYYYCFFIRCSAGRMEKGKKNLRNLFLNHQCDGFFRFNQWHMPMVFDMKMKRSKIARKNISNFDNWIFREKLSTPSAMCLFYL